MVIVLPNNYKSQARPDSMYVCVGGGAVIDVFTCLLFFSHWMKSSTN